MYPSQAWQKVWTGGQVMKILKKRFQSHLFYCLNVWTCEQVSVFLFHVFFLFRILHNFDKKCGQVDKQWKFWKKSFNLLYFVAWKCGHLDKKLTFYFISSFFLALFNFSAKSADRWTSNENSEKKFQPYMLYCLKVWTCGQESVFLFYVLFLLCTLHKHDKKCGQVDK